MLNYNHWKCWFSLAEGIGIFGIFGKFFFSGDFWHSFECWVIYDGSDGCGPIQAERHNRWIMNEIVSLILFGLFGIENANENQLEAGPMDAQRRPSITTFPSKSNWKLHSNSSLKWSIKCFFFVFSTHLTDPLRQFAILSQLIDLMASSSDTNIKRIPKHPIQSHQIPSNPIKSRAIPTLLNSEGSLILKVPIKLEFNTLWCSFAALVALSSRNYLIIDILN